MMYTISPQQQHKITLAAWQWFYASLSTLDTRAQSVHMCCQWHILNTTLHITSTKSQANLP